MVAIVDVDEYKYRAPPLKQKGKRKVYPQQNNVQPKEDGWTCSAESVGVHRQTSQTTTKHDRNERGGQTAFSPRLGSHQEDLHPKQCCSQTWSVQYWQSKNMNIGRHRPFEKTRREQQRPPKGRWVDMQRRVSPCSSADLADHHET